MEIWKNLRAMTFGSRFRCCNFHFPALGQTVIGSACFVVDYGCRWARRKSAQGVAVYLAGCETFQGPRRSRKKKREIEKLLEASKGFENVANVFFFFSFFDTMAPRVSLQ